MSDDEIYEHESYGMIGINNVNYGGSTALFGSPIRHDRTIKITIMSAEGRRHLHSEWYHGKNRLIELEMSAAQFSEFITTPGQGFGVPCTIRAFNGENMSQPPYRGQNEIFAAELDDDFKKVITKSKTLIDTAKDILRKKGNIKVSEREELLKTLESLVMHIESNMPFLFKQFARSMNKTVAAAKTEIDSFYTSTINRLGKTALSKLNMKLPRIVKEK